MVPLEVEKSRSSSLNISMTEAVGNKLQWSENAANHTRTPDLILNAGMRVLIVSIASRGIVERITLCILIRFLRAGIGTVARYSEKPFGTSFAFFTELRRTAFVFFMDSML